MKVLLSNRIGKEYETHITDIPKPSCEEDGQVLIKTEFSSLNYKDALAVTGKGAILKSYPLIPGIDVSGRVAESKSKKFQKGDKVLITGSGLGETRNGGYAEYVLDNEDNIITIPEGLSPRDVMIIGTAGFTALLAIHRLTKNGQEPKQGPIVVTGASGGVGQFAVKALHMHGFDVIAVTSKEQNHERLKELGAHSIIHPDELPEVNKALGSARWAGAIDNLGGKALESLVAHCDLWGNIASIGLASSHKLNTTVMPFILRGVSLLGASSNNCPANLRRKIWAEFAEKSKEFHLRSFISEEISLDELQESSEKMLAAQTTGRIVVKLDKD